MPKMPTMIRWTRMPSTLVQTAWALVAILSAASAVAAAPLGPVPGPVPFGVYDPDGAFSDDHSVTVEHLFLPWQDVSLQSLGDADAYALARHRAVLITIEPWTWSNSARNTPDALRTGIFSGLYDKNMAAICGAAGQMRSPVIVRWAQEMEDGSSRFIWAGWNPQDYIRAYRRMVDICRKAAPRARYMWSPKGLAGLERYYPGSSYVDIVGVSVFGYQPADHAEVGHDRTFDEIFAPRYQRVVGFGKPVVVAELGYSGSQAYVDAWNARVRQSNPAYPQLVGVIYFNQREVYPWIGQFGLPDWRFGRNVLK